MVVRSLVCGQLQAAMTSTSGSMPPMVVAVSSKIRAGKSL